MEPIEKKNANSRKLGQQVRCYSANCKKTICKVTYIYMTGNGACRIASESNGTNTGLQPYSILNGIDKSIPDILPIHLL